MEIMQVVGIGLVAAVFLVLLRQYRPELALQLSVVTGIIVFLMIVGRVLEVIRFLEDLASRANVSPVYLSTILKIVGIAYIAEFGAQVCRDANESAVAAKIELAAKILLMLVAVPIITAILEMIFKLMP